LEKKRRTTLYIQKNPLFSKSKGSLDVIYNIGTSYGGGEPPDIMGIRTAGNRVGSVLVLFCIGFVLAFLVFFTLIINLNIYFPFLIAFAILSWLINYFWFPRKITLTISNGGYAGQIKGSLLGNKLKVKNLPDSGGKDINIRLAIIKRQGIIETSAGTLRASGYAKSETRIYDEHGTRVLSLISTDSRYTREQFRIEKTDDLNAVEASAIAISIIEAYYRPESDATPG
jgi:hypothetical protein